MPHFAFKALARSAISGLASKLPLAILTRSIPRDVVILMYHAVSEKAAPHLRHLYDHKTPAQFEADLICLKRHFRLPTWTEFTAESKLPRRSDRPSLLITFDDGLSECYQFARPLLLKHRVPCVFFITKAFVDNRAMFFRHKASLCIEELGKLTVPEQVRTLSTLAVETGGSTSNVAEFADWILQLGFSDERIIDRICRLLGVDIAGALRTLRPYMTAGEIQQLHSEGFTIGGHSVTHPPLWEVSQDVAELEILESCRFVRTLVSAKDVPFAFPFSADGVSRALLRSIAERNSWISTMFGTNGVELDEPFLLNRVNADVPSPRRTKSNALSLIKNSYASCLYRGLTLAGGRAQ